MIELYNKQQQQKKKTACIIMFLSYHYILLLIITLLHIHTCMVSSVDCIRNDLGCRLKLAAPRMRCINSAIFIEVAYSTEATHSTSPKQHSGLKARSNLQTSW